MQSKSLSLRAKTLLSIALFAVIVTALIVLATFFDLPISQLLTKGSLEPGDYISHNGFALLFEAIGCVPFYIMPSLAAMVAFWFFARKGKKGLYVVSALCAVASVAAYTLLFKDLFAYTAEFIGANLLPDNLGFGVLTAKTLAGSKYILGLCVILAAAVTAGLIALWKRIDPATNDKMIWWCLAIVGAALFMLIVHFVKSPMGRVRFRTMNYIGDFDPFTKWYVMNGKQVLIERSAEGIVASTPETKAALIVASDTCKSFPSGHTFSAGMIYTLLGLPYVSDKCNKKGVKLLLWIGSVCFVGIVAISRIVAGAHFFSDVLFGGTIAFAGAMIAREIFVCKGCHWFALFPKKGQNDAGTDEENVIRQEGADEAQAPTDEAQEDAVIETEQAETAEETATVTGETQG